MRPAHNGSLTFDKEQSVGPRRSSGQRQAGREQIAASGAWCGDHAHAEQQHLIDRPSEAFVQITLRNLRHLNLCPLTWRHLRGDVKHHRAHFLHLTKS